MMSSYKLFMFLVSILIIFFMILQFSHEILFKKKKKKRKKEKVKFSESKKIKKIKQSIKSGNEINEKSETEN